MTPRRLRPTVLAALALAGAMLAQGESAANAGPGLRQQIEALGTALPKGRLTAADLERIDALTDQLPKQQQPELKDALDALLAKLARRLPEDAVADRFGPVYLRLAMHPGIGTWEAGSLLCQLGEHEVRCFRLDSAVQRFQQALLREPRLQFFVAQRLCRCEGGRQNYRAAREQLEIARSAASSGLLDAMRIAQLEAFLRMREGLFDSAGIAIERSRALAVKLLADRQTLSAYDEHQQLLLEMDYAVFHQNLERAIAKADALIALPDNTPMVRERAQLVRQTSRVLLGAEPDLPLLQQLFAAAVRANRDVVGAVLVGQALQKGDVELATSVAAALGGGRPLRELSPEALVAVGVVELQLAAMPSPAAERWREWNEALRTTWQRFLDEWRDLAPDAEGVAFLQMAVRRNVLSLLVRLALAAGEDAGAAEAARLYLEVDALGSTARRLGIGASTLAEVRRELLPPTGALLVCVPAPIGSFALWATADELRVLLLPAEGALRQRVLALRQQAFGRERSAGDDGVRAAAERLASGLLTPALRQRLAGPGILVVAGRELMHGLPVELLPSAGPLRWLGLERPIVYVPSLTIGHYLVLRPARTRAAVDVRVLAATTLGAVDMAQWHVQPVEVSPAELAAVVAAVDPLRIEILAPASVGELTHPRTDCELLAVFAHGIFDGQLACPAGLLLGPDPAGGSGALFAPSVPVTGLPRLLFLGVCGAARAPLRLGEDGGSRLAVAFLTAGCDLVVAGEVDVRLDEALALFGSFTDALALGEQPASALFQARRRVAAQSSHPGAWAGLRLEGRPDTRLSLAKAVPGGRAWPWVLGVLAVLLGLEGLRRSRRTVVPTGRQAR